MSERTSKVLLKTGVIGSFISGLCCFTPILTLTFGFVGLGAITGYLDYILLPALTVFIGMTLYAFIRKKDTPCDEGSPPGGYP